MAHAATSMSFRTASLSISTLLWAALLMAAVSIAPRMVPVPPLAEPDPITTVSFQPSPPIREPEILQRLPEPIGETQPIPLDIAPTSLTDTIEPSAFTGPGIQAAPAPIITRPAWIRKPSGRELGQYFPERAIAREKSGYVSLACTVRTDGNLACRVAEETPVGWGFGDAALRIAQTYQMEPATRDGVPVEARYYLRVPFELH